MSNLTPDESAALRARIVQGADGLPPRRSPARIVAVASAVAVVGAIAVGSVSIALGLGATDDTLATPSPTPSVTESRTPSPTPTPTPTQTPSPSPTPTPTQTPTQAPVVLEVGDTIVTPEQWDLVAARGWTFYYFQDVDRRVAVDPAQALPAVVTADIQRRIDAMPIDQVGQSDTSGVMVYNLLQELIPLGKQFVVVRYNVFSVPPATGGAMRWQAMASQEGWWMPLSKSRDQLIADVNAWIATNTTPGSWVVFVGPGEPDVP